MWALYGVSAACNIWQWVFSISLALATALYMFGIFLLGLSALGLLFTLTKRRMKLLRNRLGRLQLPRWRR